MVIAIRCIAWAIRSKEQDSARQSQALLAACYLGWTGQAFFLQHLFDYIHTAPIVLAVLVVAVPIHHHFMRNDCKALVIGFTGIAVAVSPLATVQRASLWRTCVMTSSNPRLYDELKVLQNPHWEDLDRIAHFLAKQNPAQKEVCCFNSDLVSLYNRLDFFPPTRIVYVQEILVYFPDRREALLEELQKTPHRFVVTDLVSTQLTAEQIERLLSPKYQLSLQKPGAKRRPYPWGYPIVFRSGNCLVHQVTGTNTVSND